MTLSRREFVIGSSLTAAYFAGLGTQIGSVAFGQTSAQRDILVVLFLRGAMDGLNFCAPVNDPQYISFRPNLRIRGDGTTPGLALANPIGTGVDFRLHPSAQPLLDLYQANALAIAHATGLTVPNRSHFEAQGLMEGGNPNARQVTGWLTRYLTTIGGQSGVVPSLAASSNLPSSLIGSGSTIAMPNVSGFALPGDSTIFTPMQSYYTGTTQLHRTGATALNALQTVNAALGRPATGGTVPTYAPEGGAVYAQAETQSGTLGSALITIARIIKMEVGLQVATLDIGGWDTHNNQGTTTGTFANNVDSLARNLMAFYNDMTRYRQRVTLVVMSEFGRRIQENNSGGTDHGRANVMMVLGANVNGGRMYGNWLGLADRFLDGGDLAVTTDYRQVLAEIIMRRGQNPQLNAVFPQLGTYRPLNIVQGSDLPVV